MPRKSTPINSSAACFAVYDVDHERGTVMIRQGKGQKDRVIPIGERALAWIDKYLVEVRPQLVVEPDPQNIFLTIEGEALHPDWLSAMARGYVQTADIKKRGACHLFRHTMATQMLEGGADIRFIQAMLGHSNLRATEIYTQVSIRKLKDIHTATHPAALLKKREQKPDVVAEDPEETADALEAALAAEADEDAEPE